MLKNLVVCELNKTKKIMFKAYAVLIGVSIVFSLLINDDYIDSLEKENTYVSVALDVVLVVLLAVFAVMIIALLLGGVFYTLKNFNEDLTEDGEALKLDLTEIRTHIFSKCLAAAFLNGLNFTVVIFSCLTAMSGIFAAFWAFTSLVSWFLTEKVDVGFVETLIYEFEFAVIYAGAAVSLAFRTYAALSVSGYYSSNVLVSVIVFVLIGFIPYVAVELFSSVYFLFQRLFLLVNIFVDFGFHPILWFIIFALAVGGLFYYFSSYYFLKKRLNQKNNGL